MKNRNSYSPKAKKTSVRGLIESPAFRQGFHDVKHGIEHQYDATPNKRGQAAYERGRQFAYLFNGDLVCQYDRALPSAIVYLERMARLKLVL